MKKYLSIVALLLFALLLGGAQTVLRVNGNGSSGLSYVGPVASLPTSCNIGELAYATDTSTLYASYQSPCAWQAANPGASGLTSVGLSTNLSFMTVGASPLTTNGTLTLNGTTGETANEFVATPNGSTGVVGLRTIVAQIFHIRGTVLCASLSHRLERDDDEHDRHVLRRAFHRCGCGGNLVCQWLRDSRQGQRHGTESSPVQTVGRHDNLRDSRNVGALRDHSGGNLYRRPSECGRSRSERRDNQDQLRELRGQWNYLLPDSHLNFGRCQRDFGGQNPMRKLFALTLLLLGAFVLLGAQGITLGKGATYGKGMTISPGSSGGGGGATFVNSGFSVITACAAAATSCSVTYSPVAGHQLYVGIVESAAQAVTSVTDNGGSGGSTYVSLWSRVSVNSGNQFLHMYCTSSIASSVTTITSNGGGQAVMVMEFSGDAGACTIDQSNLTPLLNSATHNWTTSATSATTNANDIAFGFFYDVTIDTSTYTGTNGYTCLNGSYNAFVGNGNTLCYLILSSTGAQTSTMTNSAADSGYGIISVVK